MTDTPDHLETVRLAKQEQARRVIATFALVRAELDSEPDLWFGGNPSAYDELERWLSTAESTISRQFQLGSGA